MTRASASISIAFLLLGCGGRAAPVQSSSDKPVHVPRAEGQVAEGSVDCDDEGDAPALRAKPPVGYVEMTVFGVVPTEGGNAVVLVDAARRVGIPVFVGGTEALSIQLRLEGRKYQRPLTHDLLDAIVSKLKARIVAARVDKIENDVFIGAVLIQRGSRIEEIDSRVSDALALALGNRVPIYVAQQVIDSSGVDASKLGITPGETA